MSNSGLRLYNSKAILRLRIEKWVSIVLSAILLVFTIQIIGGHNEEKASFQEEVNHQKVRADVYKEERDNVQKELDEIKRKISATTDLIRKANPSLSPAKAEQYALWELKYSAKYRIPTPVGMAISWHESAYRNGIISYDGSSIGIKQINLNAHKEQYGLTMAKLNDPEFNIELGYKMLAAHRMQYRSLAKGIERYRGSIFPSTNFQYRMDVMHKAGFIERYFAKYG